MKQKDNLLLRIDRQHDELLERIDALDRLVNEALHDWPLSASVLSEQVTEEVAIDPV